MAHSIVQSGDLPFIERPYRPQDEPRHVASLTEALGLESSRASVWRYPPGVRGRRHREGAQEEVFACLEGTITLARRRCGRPGVGRPCGHGPRRDPRRPPVARGLPPPLPAGNGKSNVVVIGGGGREGPRDYLVGSTVERIVRHSPVPVLVIK